MARRSRKLSRWRSDLRDALLAAVRSGRGHTSEWLEIARRRAKDVPEEDMVEVFIKHEVNKAKDRLRLDGHIEMGQDGQIHAVEEIVEGMVDPVLDHVDERRKGQITSRLAARVVWNKKYKRHKVVATAEVDLAVYFGQSPNYSKATKWMAEKILGPPEAPVDLCLVKLQRRA